MDGEGDEEEVSFADEQLRKAVRRSQASMKPAQMHSQVCLAAQESCGVGEEFHKLPVSIICCLP